MIEIMTLFALHSCASVQILLYITVMNGISLGRWMIIRISNYCGSYSLIKHSYFVLGDLLLIDCKVWTIQIVCSRFANDIEVWYTVDCQSPNMISTLIHVKTYHTFVIQLNICIHTYSYFSDTPKYNEPPPSYDNLGFGLQSVGSSSPQAASR